MKAVEVCTLSKVYKGKKGHQVQALSNLTLSLEEGEIFGFLGPNGAGKSTTIKTLMGQIFPTSGQALIFGKETSSAEAHARIGYLPENPSFFDFLSGREYLEFVGAAYGLKGEELSSAANEALDKMDLVAACDRPIRSYSKGMTQRLGLAQAMLHDPDLYILDEPMSGLDPIGRALVKEMILDLKARGKTVFFSTHITSDIEVICDRVGLIVKGQLVSVDNVKNLLQRGIEGYKIQLSMADGLIVEETVSKEHLKHFLQECIETGRQVERIEPTRKDLERFFLDIVKQGIDETLHES